MINNTFVKADGPLYINREDALKAPGAIFIHLKKGGIYRKMGVSIYTGDKCAEELDREPCSVYEHLWPHAHEFYHRPDSEFEEVVETEHGKNPRFVRVKDS